MSQVSQPLAPRPQPGTEPIAAVAPGIAQPDQTPTDTPEREGAGHRPPAQPAAPPVPAHNAPAVTFGGLLTALFAGQAIEAQVEEAAPGRLILRVPEARLLTAGLAVPLDAGGRVTIDLARAAPQPVLRLLAHNGVPLPQPVELAAAIEPAETAPQATGFAPLPRRMPGSLPPTALPPAPLPGGASTGLVATMPQAAAEPPGRAPAPDPAGAPPPHAGAPPSVSRPGPAAPHAPDTLAPRETGRLVGAAPAAPLAPPPETVEVRAAGQADRPAHPFLAGLAADTPPAGAPRPAAAQPLAAQPVPAQPLAGRLAELSPRAPPAAAATAAVAPPDLTRAPDPPAPAPFAVPDAAIAARSRPAQAAPHLTVAPGPAQRPPAPSLPGEGPFAPPPAPAEGAPPPVEIGPVPPDEAPVDQRAASAWAALSVALRGDALATAHIRDMLAPQAGGRLAGGLAFLILALRGGSLAHWLGSDESGRGSLPSRPGGARTVEREFGELARIARESAPDGWRTLPLGIQDADVVRPVMLHVHRPPRRRKGDPDPADAGTRFLLDFTLSRAGPIRLDGFARPRALDLILRSERPVPPSVQDRLRGVFEESLADSGIAGSLAFQRVGKLAPPPLPSKPRPAPQAVLA